MSDQSARYDRQNRVLGADAQILLSTSSVLISGMNGLGVEIAKNVILSGVRVVAVHDVNVVEMSDLSSQFCVKESDIGKNRAAASREYLAELNPHVEVKVVSSAVIDESIISQYKIVVVVNALEKELLCINELCRKTNVKFISTDMNGPFTRVFVDFGVKHTVKEPNDEKIKISPIDSISNTNPVVVKVIDVEPHRLVSGNFVTFSLVKGMTEVNGLPPAKVKEIISDVEFSVDIDGSKFSKYVSGGYATQVKIPFDISHKALSEELNNPTFVPFSSGNPERSSSVHAGFAALSLFREQHNGKLPRSHNGADAKEVVDSATTLFAKLFGTERRLDVMAVRVLARTAAGNAMPIASVMGGIVAQEVIKGTTGKFVPINQWVYIDHMAMVSLPLPTEADASPTNTRYDGQIAIIGQKAQDKLNNLKVFVVGAGAIGCEHLKNLAFMGVSAGPQGIVHVTDMDTIELSNLSRQFLFRSDDLHQSKSERACLAIKKLNPHFKTKTYIEKVGYETENIFSEHFWEKIDVACNALDNVAARNYVDEKCVQNHRPLLECGTLGTKGNTQDVIPHLTANYSSTIDPPEPSIPLCTVKNLPYLIEHTIEYAMGLFRGYFTDLPAGAAEYLRDPDAFEKKVRSSVQPLELVDNLRSVLGPGCLALSFDDCIAWARREFEENFANQITQLLFQFPPDLKDDVSCKPFWGGKNKLPLVTSFNPADDLHVSFVAHAAYIRAAVFGIPVPAAARATDSAQDSKNELNFTYVKNVAKSVWVATFVPKSCARLLSEVSGASSSQSSSSLPPSSSSSTNPPRNVTSAPTCAEVACAELEQALKKLQDLQPPSRKNSPLKGVVVQGIDFEKDDESNHHVDFIAAVANLRARNYGIMTADVSKIKGIAGKIIPAVATTTSTVSGLALVELYKLVADKMASTYRTLTADEKLNKSYLFSTWFVNLAVNMFTVRAPDVAMPLCKGSAYTVWDAPSFQFDHVPTVREILERITTENKWKITFVTSGDFTLYSSFEDEAKRATQLSSQVVETLEKMAKKPLEKGTQYIPLELAEEDDNINLPTIRITFPPI